MRLMQGARNLFLAVSGARIAGTKTVKFAPLSASLQYLSDEFSHCIWVAWFNNRRFDLTAIRERTIL
jgi:hypothetical protein